MADIVRIQKLNEVHIRIAAPSDISYELSEYFAFRPEGYQFNPRFKARQWDGFIRLFQVFKKTLYLGLIPYVKKFCEERDYELVIDPELQRENHVDKGYALELAKMIGAPFMPRDYQQEYVESAIRDERGTLISPTGSGKSFIIYLLSRHYQLTEDARSLIIVPTVGLVSQMKGDFVDYGGNADDIHTIKAGKEKDSNKQYVISTWQSVAKMPQEWFDQFGVIFGDEAHLFAAKSLTGLMEKTVNIRYKFGLTGTLKGSKVHKLVLEGLFGTVRKFTSTKELIDDGSLAELKINCLVLNHKKEDKSLVAKLKKKAQPNQRYALERGFIMGHEKRNLYIRNLLWSLKDQNNLILFDQVEKHGKILEPLLRKEGRELHFIHGGVDGDIRDRVKEIAETSVNNDILASTGVFSTGISIKRIHNLIMVSGGKSQIKVLQSIGRLLRKGNGADSTTLYDFSDNIKYGGKDNYSLVHLEERVSMYANEGFNYRIITVDI